LQPGDLIAAVENMLEDGDRKRQFYLGIDFIRKNTPMPKLQIWQEKIMEGYPRVGELSIDSAGDINIDPEGTTGLRIHSVGGWGAVTMGKNLALTSAQLMGLNIKANPKYGSEKKGQPTTFYALLSHEPLLLNCEVKHVGVVLSPDPNVFHHGIDPLEGLGTGGVFVVQSDQDAQGVWESLPQSAQDTICQKNIRIFFLNGFEIARAEASDVELKYRMQGVAFMGAFFRTAPLMEQEGLSEERLFEGIRKQLSKKFGHLGERVVEDNLRVIRRGFDEVEEVDYRQLDLHSGTAASLPVMPERMEGDCQDGIGNPGRFWDQVCSMYKTGQDVLADPFIAMSAMPAATASTRDMTGVRFTIPKFVPENCTGCSNCWTQCPDSAIPGVVNTVEEVLEAAILTAENPREPFARFRQLVKYLGKESRKLMRAEEFTTYTDVLEKAYENVGTKMKWDADRRSELGVEYDQVYSALKDFPLARTTPFFEVPEGKAKDSGGLLSITVNPETCKGCDICVAVCPDDALVTIIQTDEAVDELRENWTLWKNLPQTRDDYIKISNLEEGIGVLSSLLLKKENYQSMVGGDGACMGCGEKTVIHLVVAAVNALMSPRVDDHVKKLDEIIQGLDAKARSLLSADADLEDLVKDASASLDLTVDSDKTEELSTLVKAIRDLRDLHWRYTEGPSGRGRANLGFTNSTGCTSVWGSSYPYNPYPFPWVNHLFQDAPSVAVGIFEGHMRKMADGFIAVRRAQKLLDGNYDETRDEEYFQSFNWELFDDEEFNLCPPLFAVGGDGAMMDIGFQNLSRLLATNKPIRVMVVDTQVYSNTGGQACTSGFGGQISDMAAFGPDQRGKKE
ncbi:MAG: 2-oxoacid:acceptor oxidoreductase family protein, partial [Deltaproteobacteria bacterium]|nr:2-oxoacid:acceptor oxidoreductase family protein [Deltaproteobacteria bacterium]